MNSSIFRPQSGGSDTTGLSDLTPSSTYEQAWQQVLAHSINGLVGLVAVRNDNGSIVDFRYLFINQVALRDTFRSRPTEIHDITGELLTDFFPSITETAIWQTYVDVVDTGSASKVEQHYNVDGRDFWVSQSAAPFGQDGLLLSYSETSDLHQAARRISRQTTLLNGVLNSSPNAIVVFEAVRDSAQEIIDFQISLANRQFDVLMGQSDGYFMGMLLTDVYPISAGQMVRLREMTETGATTRFDKFIPARGCWIDITLTPLNDGFVATIQDITADKQVRQQLETTVQELHLSNHNLEQFAYVASHDLQEPLRKIVSFGDVLNDQFASELSESAADLIRRMQTSAGRMRSLVQDLLTYARLVGTPESFAIVDLNHLIASVADDLEMTIYERRATVQVDPLPAVWGDPAQLRQLFQNLMSNALKFHQPTAKPHVLIRGQVAADADLPAELSVPDASQAGRRYASIEIIDNGIGFDDHYLDRVFSIFQRLHGRMHYAGTGMGLALCKKVVDLHQGYITATSQEGQGATFRLLLPMQ